MQLLMEPTMWLILYIGATKDADVSTGKKILFTYASRWGVGVHSPPASFIHITTCTHVIKQGCCKRADGLVVVGVYSHISVSAHYLVFFVFLFFLSIIFLAFVYSKGYTIAIKSNN